MKDKRSQIIKKLIYELSQKANIISEDGIMKWFNSVDIYHTLLYFNNNCGA